VTQAEPVGAADTLSEAEIDAWAGAVADAMIAAYRRSRVADGTSDPDANPPPSAHGPLGGADPDGEESA
jgi:hypothetical protein